MAVDSWSVGLGFCLYILHLLFQGKVDLPIQGMHLKLLNIMSIFQWYINI